MGEVCLVPPGLECCVGQRQVLLRPDPSVVDGRFLLFALQSTKVQHEIAWNEGTGSTVSNVRIPVLEALRIPTPPLEIQREIGVVLGTLDDRIELLSQTNSTLESIAQALFRSWFIDFDPVRAKAEGREPEGMDAETAALFPSEFEESELGAIPKGWSVSEIGKAVDCVGGGTPSTREATYWEPPVHHWATPKDLSGLCSPVVLDTDRRLSNEGLAKVSSGLLPVGTLLMSSRAPIGYLAITEVPLAINQGFIAMVPGGVLPPGFLYFWCQTNMDGIKQKANGSTFMEISKAAFRPIPLVVPSQPVVAKFSALIGPIFKRISANEQHRGNLSDLRDALLPRLISGQLRLRGCHELHEEALI